MGELLGANDSRQGDSYHERIGAPPTPASPLLMSSSLSSSSSSSSTSGSNVVVSVEELVAAAAAAVAAKTADAKAMEAVAAASAAATIVGECRLDANAIEDADAEAAVVELELARDDTVSDVVYRVEELVENRVERSNSCSQAESGGDSDLARMSASFGARNGAIGTASTAGAAAAAALGTVSLTSVSHDNLASANIHSLHNSIITTATAATTTTTTTTTAAAAACDYDYDSNYIVQGQAAPIEPHRDDNEQDISSSTANIANLSTARTDLLIDDNTIKLGPTTTTTAPTLVEPKIGSSSSSSSSNSNVISTDKKQQQQQQQQQQFETKSVAAATGTTSSRFFSSKLNTGSLWSLLSVGSATSTSALNEISPQSNGDRTSTNTATPAPGGDLSTTGASANASEHDKQESSMTNFFARQLQFATRRQQPSSTSSFEQQSAAAGVSRQASSMKQQNVSLSSSSASAPGQELQEPPTFAMKYRFNVKYIGSAMLHKNFTMPMLEWVAKDIRRQTNRSLNQRQFTIPIREIMFEIQSNQLIAISCKDGHCIFVHPMHCVSKYAQLQHDSSCFSYIIRDNKDSPSFCHLFQAKCANKVHDIFNAIREVTTRCQFQPVSHDHTQHHQASTANRLQKSASTDWKSMLAPKSLPSVTGIERPLQPTGLSKTPPTNSSTSIQQHGSSGTGNNNQSFQQQQQQQPFMSTTNPKQRQQQQQAKADYVVAPSSASSSLSSVPTTGPAPLSCAQFENSYQFEVMFVKRVKLQCRRVPPTFVDDALETLKTFETPKAQIKGVVTKRIISASVDERQEYDETCQSPGTTTAAASTAVSSQTDRDHPNQSQNQRQQFNKSTGGAIEEKELDDDVHRRGSSVSLKTPSDTQADLRESKSCQQSPNRSLSRSDQASQPETANKANTGGEANGSAPGDGAATCAKSVLANVGVAGDIKKHQSVDCLKSIDYATGPSAKSSAPTPTYYNDFSPYNTITSSDLNERIAAIPVVSSSVSLDHETRQRLARQVRETIMAKAATIKKDVYASGDKLDSSGSSKVLDLLSCNGQSCVPPIDQDTPMMFACTINDDNEQRATTDSSRELSSDRLQLSRLSSSSDQANSGAASDSIAQQRRSSASANNHGKQQQQQAIVSNNFDLFRRASSRQVVKNRTMLLLIGKDELCAISIDKHQMLFSKSFNSVSHCLQGINNKDHFGLICRDSGKINPQTESYAGFVFKCQSDKVVREIMGALKQVIYNSQHNYHTSSSPYNPLNSVHQHQYVAAASAAAAAAAAAQAKQQRSPKLDRHQLGKSVDATLTSSSLLLSSSSSSSSSSSTTTTTTSKDDQKHQQLPSIVTSSSIGTSDTPQQSPATGSSAASSSSSGQQQQLATSLAKKRGFVNSLELDEAQLRQQRTRSTALKKAAPPTAPALNQHAYSNAFGALAATPLPPSQPAATKNPIKSMFCDDCPLYWFHRLCCDIESLPGEASKAIILRRIDSSLSEREQDDVYSKFSEFNIESIDEHNEIFMSILRQLSERKQMKHSQSQAHLSAIAKSVTLARQQSSEHLKQQQQQQQQQQQKALMITNGHMGTASEQLNLANSNPSSALSTAAAAAAAAAAGLTRSNSGGKGGGAGGNTSGHQRSGSSSGSLAFVIGQSNANHQSLVDASSAALDNFKRAKNSISVSIENMLKRRQSNDQQQDDFGNQRADDGHALVTSSRPTPLRSGSFKGGTRELRAAAAGAANNNNCDAHSADCSPSGLVNLTRSQSTSDYHHHHHQQQQQLSSPMNAPRLPGASWRDSLSRTINDDLTNPLVGFFRRRGSFARNEEQPGGDSQQRISSSDNLTIITSESDNSNQQADCGQLGPSSSSSSTARLGQPVRIVAGTSSPSSLLSGAFWKKSIFDKIHQPSGGGGGNECTQANTGPNPIKHSTGGSTVDSGSDRLVKVAPDSQQQQQQQQAQQEQQQRQQQRKRTREELRLLWKKAILEQITLLKMDKQNQKLQANSIECNIQRMKLNYRDVPYGKDASLLWDRLLKQDPSRKVQFVEVARLVRLGVPKQRRGEVWMFLMNQYQLRHGISFQPASDCEFRGDADQTYRSLLSQLSTQQHEIFVDIGRTFPAHPYYSQYLSIGQLSLFNLLKAYSLLDKDVGYCQGLSFVAGILLLHVDSEDEAFELMRHLLFNFGLRKQYLPSMNALHLQLYQLTRLLRDHQYEIFDQFDKFDISPSLYAAPWFLTLFASQFPLGFVARLLDLLYLIGIEAIFRVSLTLLAYHRESILKCTSLETTMEFMKRDLVIIEDKNMAKIFDDAIALDLRNKLIDYEIEYSFYCAEDKARASSGGGSHHYLNHHHHHHHHHALNSSRQSANSSSSTVYSDVRRDNQGSDIANEEQFNKTTETEIDGQQTGQDDSVGLTSEVADATATVIIQHLLANNHLRSLRSNYSY